MQELIASVDHIKFDLELAVEQQLGAQPLPFPGMDSACGHRALRGSFFPGVLGAGSWCLGRGCVCGGVCVREGGLRGSLRLAQVSCVDPPNFCAPCEVSVLIRVFVFPT